MSIGVIFDIKRFALHDGSGLRTTLFLKGCPLSCPWCQNPEGIDSLIEVRYTPSRCIRCGTCIATCPEGALAFSPDKTRIDIDQSRCTKCGRCVRTCPTNALQFTGLTMSATDAARELLKDKVFYDVSGGGVTLSGGEPLAQSEFAIEVLSLCKKEGVHTAVETSLYVSSRVVRRLTTVVDHLYVDLKIANSDEHARITGVPNERIRRNLEMVLGSEIELTIRIPAIPRFTATEANLKALGRYVASLDPQPEVEILNFNPLARQKYELMSVTWPFERDSAKYTPAEMNRMAAMLKRAGVARVTV